MDKETFDFMAKIDEKAKGRLNLIILFIGLSVTFCVGVYQGYTTRKEEETQKPNALRVIDHGTIRVIRNPYAYTYKKGDAVQMRLTDENQYTTVEVDSAVYVGNEYTDDLDLGGKFYWDSTRNTIPTKDGFYIKRLHIK